MLVIRDAQLHILTDEARRRFFQELLDCVREQVPGKVAHLDRDGLARRVRYALDRAERNRLRWESSLTLFVLVLFSYGPDFDERPAVRRYLDELHVGHDERMLEIAAHAPAECWERRPEPVLETLWRLAVS